MLTQEGAANKEIKILKKVIKNLEVGKNNILNWLYANNLLLFGDLGI